MAVVVAEDGLSVDIESQWAQLNPTQGFCINVGERQGWWLLIGNMLKYAAAKESTKLIEHILLS